MLSLSQLWKYALSLCICVLSLNNTSRLSLSLHRSLYHVHVSPKSPGFYSIPLFILFVHLFSLGGRHCPKRSSFWSLCVSCSSILHHTHRPIIQDTANNKRSTVDCPIQPWQQAFGLTFNLSKIEKLFSSSKGVDLETVFCTMETTLKGCF